MGVKPIVSMGIQCKTIKRTLSLFRRHSEKFVKTDGCWEWTAGMSHGYGAIGQDGYMMLAHRVSWVLYRGPIPDGMLVLHKCNNRSCVNPDHLYVGDYSDNMRDTVMSGRGGSVCRPPADK